MYRKPSARKYRQSFFDFNPQISHGLLAILLFLISGISILGFFNLAGVVGAFIDSLLAIAFGHVRYVFPIILLIIAALTIKDTEYEYKSTHVIGAILFFLSFNGLIHIQTPLNEMLDTALQGYGGGLSGLALSWPLLKYASYWGGMLILSALLLVSLIFLFNTTLAQIVALNKKLFLGLGWFGRQIIGFFGLFKKQNPTVAVAGQNIAVEEDDFDDEEIGGDTEEAETTKEHKFSKFQIATAERVAQEKKKMITVEPPKKINYKIPGTDLLFISKSKPTSGDIKSNAEVIKDTFHNFGIEVDMGETRVGPTVTQFSLKPAKGIKVSRITNLSNDLALALAAHPIRIEAPIPGQSMVGIEVPNQKVAMVTLRELLESDEFRGRNHNMSIALGKDVAGKVWFGDLPKMPHLLIAGATGSGKTVCVNTIILSLIYQNTPETLRFIMVDPKRVELTMYNGIPHLLTPVITDPGKTVNALKWAITEMERRFDALAAAGKRDIESYNKTATEKMPHIVFIIDELADLMALAASEVEAGIIRLAQMARAVGIHLVVATQRPSVEVITGLMKANIPARIAFSVASSIDSRTILDCMGAEKLLGRGDMLFLTADLSKPRRLQGSFVSEEEMKRVVDFIKSDEPPAYNEAIINKESGGGTMSMFSNSGDDRDSMFMEAKKLVIESGKASASLMQRRLKVGYARAARLLDELEEAGIVGPADGAKPREVFEEHLMPEPEMEIPLGKQTMDAGGTVFATKEISSARENFENENEEEQPEEVDFEFEDDEEKINSESEEEENFSQTDEAENRR